MQMRRTEPGDRGASLVEFAFVVPLLAMFLFAIVQFGLAYDAKQSINSAAREGARYAALETSTVAGIEQRAIGSYIGAGEGTPTVRVYQPSNAVTPEPAGSTTEMPCDNPTGDGIVAVEVEIGHLLDIPFVGRRTIDIEARAEFLCE